MTMVNDPIGDLLTRIRNAQAVRKSSCMAPWSRIKQELCEVLKREGMIEDVRVTGEAPHQEMEVIFVPGRTLTLTRASKPGRRLYTKSADIRPVLRGFGIAVLTTSEGLLTDKQAKAKKIGGEVLCTIS
jgi:small subunit ribosomal protein S8